MGIIDVLRFVLIGKLECMLDMFYILFIFITKVIFCWKCGMGLGWFFVILF